MRKVLIISRGAWNSNNSVGNTLSNLFGTGGEFEFHNVYLRSEVPGDNPCKTIYQITEKGLIKSWLNFRQTGCVQNSKPSLIEADREEQLYSSFQGRNLYSLWFARDILWAFGHWRNNLRKHIEIVQPDVIFMPVFGCVYAHRVLNVIRKQSGAKVVLFHADDHYTLKHRNYSPLFWLYRFWMRGWIKHSVNYSVKNYCISDLQISDYNKCFNTQCELLQKFGDFSGSMPECKIGHPIKLVFTGNMECGRWRSLCAIARAVDAINKDILKCTLDIYSATKLTQEQLLLFENKTGVTLRGFVQSSEIPGIQSDADVLIHVESFLKKEKLQVRQSFSTKIVDYLSKGKCILAVGPSDVASIQYFEKYDSGYVISSYDEITTKLDYLVSNPSIMQEYAAKAWECGFANNDYSKRQKFFNTLLSL